DPQQANHVFRDTFVSQCYGPKTCPGIFGFGNVPYDAYTFTNSAAGPACVVVNLDAGSCTGFNYIFSASYLGSFDPANVCNHYLADMGSSPDPVGSYGFIVPAGATFVVVLDGIEPGMECAYYVLTVSGLVCPPTPTGTPPT